MTDSARSGEPLSAAPNPFASRAFARVSSFDDASDETDTITIPTTAIRDALRYLDEYLATVRGGGAAGAGTVVAVLGDYGTGKTHLGVELLRHARAEGGKNIHVMYIDAQPGTFIPLYRSFYDQLDVQGVLTQVRDYYADVLIDHLVENYGPQLSGSVVETLRSGAQQPEDVIKNIGLPANVLIGMLRDRLRSATGNESFARALTLFRQPDYTHAVWNWLRGNPPDRILVEQGIDDALDTEAAALEAMGVFALLYGQRGHRLVLVIDELERPLLGAVRDDEASVAAFRQLLAVLVDAGAFLVLMGLPDFLGALPGDVRERLGTRVEMPAMTASDTEEFIRQSLRRAGRGYQLFPFTPGAVEFIVQLAEQIPRKILRLCYHVYHRSQTTGQPVTPEMVADVAATHTEILSAESVRTHIATTLRDQGRPFIPDHVLTLNDATSRVDFWVYAERNRENGCAILVTDSLIREPLTRDLVARIAELQRATPDAEVLLVVNGYISEEDVQLFQDQLGRPPLVYRQLSFSRQLETQLDAIMTLLAQGEGADALVTIRQRVERMNRQQSNTYQFLEQVAVDMDRWRTTSESRLESLLQQMDTLATAISGPRGDQAETVGDAAEPSPTPDDVRSAFESALDSLAEIDRVETLLEATFRDVTEEVDAAGVNQRLAATGVLGQERFTGAYGLAVLLRQLVGVFETAVGRWFDRRAREAGGRGANDEDLQLLCRAYARIYEVLPLRQLEDFEDLIRRISAMGSVGYTSPVLRRSDARERLENLGTRVERLALHGPR